MFHYNLYFGAVLILWLCLPEVYEGSTLMAQTASPPSVVVTPVRFPTNQTQKNMTQGISPLTPTAIYITNYVTITNIVRKTNYVNVRVLPPQVDAAKVELESKRIKQNVLEYQMKRAIAGDARALYDVGLRYLTGDGVEKDREKALDYLRQSAMAGELLAQRKLQNLGEPVPEPK